MWWALAVVAVILVAAVVVDRRRGRPRRSGDDRLQDAAYGETAATAQSIRRPDGNGGGAAS